MIDRTKPLVEMRDISISFGGIKAVDQVSIDLYPGEVVGLLGHNGAGKSTLIKCLSGAYRKDAGQILINGQEVEINNPRDARDQNIETIYQTLALADNLDAASNLFLGREIFKFRLGPFSWLDRKAMRDRTMEALKTTAVKIPNVDNPIRNMSGGQRQCVAIARTAAFASKLVIMDEPTAALGVQETAQVENIIRGLKERGIPMVLVSHNLRQVFDLVDRIVVFRRGRIVASLRRDETDGNDIVSYITGVKGNADGAIA